MNRYILISITLIICSLLTGCWNYREIDSIYIVTGIGVDKVPESDEYNITTELINIKENELEKGFKSILLDTKGDSILDAVTRMVRISAKKLYWNHASSLIISEEVAREGIMPFLDVLVRNEEGRLAMNIFISRDESAKKTLEQQSFSTDIRAYELKIMVDESNKMVKTPSLQLYEVINILSTPQAHIVLPTVDSTVNNNEVTNILSGGAVFKEGKLVGFLTETDIIPFLYIQNKIKGGILKVKSPEDSLNNTIIFEIFHNKTKIKPIYNGESIDFDISVKTEVSIAELSTMTDYISSSGREKLKQLAEDSLKTEIEDIIDKVRKEYGFDIFGFGNIVRQRDPKLWKTIEKDWDSIFMDANFNIVCDINIRSSGHFNKPIRAVE